MFDQSTSVVLSREEVLAILALLQVVYIPGLDRDPIPSLTVEQQATEILCGERSLRARELARMGADGRIQVQRDILELIGTCGYAEGSLVVTYLTDTRTRTCFAHRRGGVFVLHTTPEMGLHSFEGAGDRQALVDAIAAFSGWVDTFQEGGAPVVISRQLLDSAREAAIAQRLADARMILSAKNNPSETVDRLVELLAQTYELTVVQSMQPRGEDSVAVQTLSVLQTSVQQWLMIQEESGLKKEETYVLQPVTSLQTKAAVSALNW